MRRVRTRAAGRPFLHDDSGAALVELALVIPIFFLLFFALIDFGRLGFSWVMAEKAMQRAVRIAAVRPPVCTGVPEIYSIGTASPAPEYGTACGAGAGVCANPGTFTCTAAVGTPTATEIWAAVNGLLPNDATPANIRFTYTYDPNLGFLGGPYVPLVTAELQNMTFQFVHPLAGLAQLAGAGASTIGADIPFPAMSVSLPGEDLAHGTAG